MTARRTPHALSIVLAFALALAACSPAATPNSAPIATQTIRSTQVVAQTQVAEAEFLPATPLPYPTNAPTSGPIALAAVTATPAPFTFEPTPVPTTAADMFFEQYGVNPFVDTAEDHLSTFALDVDTASYAIARRYVTDGLLPPAEAVRVEEFVNYFDQGYTPPPDVAFAIYADGAPSRSTPAAACCCASASRATRCPTASANPPPLPSSSTSPARWRWRAASNSSSAPWSSLWSAFAPTTG